MTVALTVERVAERIGCSEASAFAHAFARWTGLSPRRWARSVGAATGS